MVYLITVKTLENQVLTFKVKKYSIDNGMVSFQDRGNLEKHFSVERCQIEEIRQEGEF